MAHTPDWLLLTHTHPHFLDPPERASIQKALPADAFDPAVLVDVVNFVDDEPITDLDAVDWVGMQRRQAQQLEQHRTTLDRFRRHKVAYFGGTLIPLALDLGYRIGTWQPVETFQHHHRLHTWQWQEGSRLDHVTVEGAPTSSDSTPGDVVLTVSTTNRIPPELVREQVPEALDYVHVSTRPFDRDVLQTREDLERVVAAVDDAVSAILQYRPKCGRLHLFLAGPVGLAFRIGAILPTYAPEVQTYQFDPGGQRYVPALTLAQAERAPVVPPVTLKILMVAAAPRNQTPLQIGREHDELRRRLVAADGGAEIVSRLAIDPKDLMEILDAERPNIIHFSGHGDTAGDLMGQDANNSAAHMTPEFVVEALHLAGSDGRPGIRVAVLNACHSAALARRLVDDGVVQHAIGMEGPIHDDAAILFADGFYRSLGRGDTVERAFRAGRVQVLSDYAVKRHADRIRLFPPN